MRSPNSQENSLSKIVVTIFTRIQYYIHVRPFPNKSMLMREKYTQFFIRILLGISKLLLRIVQKEILGIFQHLSCFQVYELVLSQPFKKKGKTSEKCCTMAHHYNLTHIPSHATTSQTHAHYQAPPHTTTCFV